MLLKTHTCKKIEHFVAMLLMNYKHGLSFSTRIMSEGIVWIVSHVVDVCDQMSSFRWSQLLHYHTSWPDIRTVLLSEAGLLITMTTCHCGNWPVGVSGMMGVQVSLVRVSRTSWLFFPSLNIPRSTTHSLTQTHRIYFNYITNCINESFGLQNNRFNQMYYFISTREFICNNQVYILINSMKCWHGRGPNQETCWLFDWT